MLRATTAPKTALFAAVVAVQALDFLTFVGDAQRFGVGPESNALARVLYVSYGTAGPALLKLVATVVVVLALVWVARRRPAGLLPAWFLATAIGVVGLAANVFFVVAHSAPRPG